MIRFTEVAKHYDRGERILANVNLDINQGELVYLTGKSGAGKTTLLNLLTLVERPTRGSITVDGEDLGRIKGRKISGYRRKLGMVFQDDRLLKNHTIFDNIALPLILQNNRLAEIDHKVKAALHYVGLMAKQHCFPPQLSGGERQRVGIARAIITRPKIILADEPTGHLDAELAEDIMNLFRQFNQRNKTTIITATHDLQHVARARGRVIEIVNGRVRSYQARDPDGVR